MKLFKPPTDQERDQQQKNADERGPELSIELLAQRLDGIQATLDLLLRRDMVKDWYTTAEAAAVLERAEFTVREWCRLGRIKAQKRPCGRGNAQEWIISHEELARYQNFGLLPIRRFC